MAEGHAFEQIEGLICFLSLLFWVYLYCYIASEITTNLAQIGELAYQSNWHSYPSEVQTCARMMIRRAQVRFEFDGLSLFYCNMATFATVWMIFPNEEFHFNLIFNWFVDFTLGYLILLDDEGNEPKIKMKPIFERRSVFALYTSNKDYNRYLHIFTLFKGIKCLNFHVCSCIFAVYWQ